MHYVLLICPSSTISSSHVPRYRPFIGVSRSTDTRSGLAWLWSAIALAPLVTWLINHYILVSLGLAYLQTIVFILVIASLVQPSR